MQLLTFSRRSTLAVMAFGLLAACGSANGDSTPATAGPALNDMVLGDPDAPVTLIEYASVTCGACYQFHRDVVPNIVERFIEPGDVKFIFREFPTPPANVAVAGFAIARCAGPDKYFDVIDDLFDSQQGIIEAARIGAVRPALEAVAARHGIEGAEAFDACLADRDIRQAIADTVLGGEEFGVSSTPTLILQGEVLPSTMQSRTPEGLSSLIEAELAALGRTVTSAESDNTSTDSEDAVSSENADAAADADN
ncbi:MAG: thioredoxin domain-containing protein [Pseudomonadota bacterium]